MNETSAAVPRCPLFGLCGGCSFQNIPYEVQLEEKRQGMMKLFEAAGHALAEKPEIHSGEAWNYRSRMDYAFFRDGLGLRKRKSFRHILPVKECFIALPTIQKNLEKIWAWWEEAAPRLDPFEVVRQEGTLKYATIRAAANTADSSVTFVLSEASEKRFAVEAEIARFAEASGIPNVLIGTVDRKRDSSIADNAAPLVGGRVLREKILGREVAYDNQSFFQNNTAMIEKLVAWVRGKIEASPLPRPELLDLYGGAGTFGVSLGDLFEKTQLIEIQGPNVDLALGNFRNAGILDPVVRLGDVLEVMDRMKGEEGASFSRPLTIVLDPPRAGLHPKFLKKIVEWAPERIFYVSCNPARFVEEWKALSAVYRLKSFALFDLFPQTPHLEAAAELVKI